MSEDRFNQKPSSEINKIIDGVHTEVLQGEGSEGLQRLEDLEQASEEFLYALQLLHSGEGESRDEVYQEARESLEYSLAYSIEAISAEDPQGRVIEAMTIIRDLDRRTESAVGAECAIFSTMTDDEVVIKHFSHIEQVVSQADPETEEQALAYYNEAIRQIVTGWHEQILERVEEHAEPNQNDTAKLKKFERIARAKQFARDVGAVALGSLPVIGAVVYMNRKNK